MRLRWCALMNYGLRLAYFKNLWAGRYGKTIFSTTF